MTKYRIKTLDEIKKCSREIQEYSQTFYESSKNVNVFTNDMCYLCGRILSDREYERLYEKGSTLIDKWVIERWMVTEVIECGRCKTVPTHLEDAMGIVYKVNYCPECGSKV